MSGPFRGRSPINAGAPGFAIRAPPPMPLRPQISLAEIIQTRMSLRTPQQQNQYAVDPLRRTRRAQGTLPPTPPDQNAAAFATSTPSTSASSSTIIAASQQTPRRPQNSIVAARVREIQQDRSFVQQGQDEHQYSQSRVERSRQQFEPPAHYSTQRGRTQEFPDDYSAAGVNSFALNAPASTSTPYTPPNPQGAAVFPIYPNADWLPPVPSPPPPAMIAPQQLPQSMFPVMPPQQNLQQGDWEHRPSETYIQIEPPNFQPPPVQYNEGIWGQQVPTYPIQQQLQQEFLQCFPESCQQQHQEAPANMQPPQNPSGFQQPQNPPGFQQPQQPQDPPGFQQQQYPSGFVPPQPVQYPLGGQQPLPPPWYAPPQQLHMPAGYAQPQQHQNPSGFAPAQPPQQPPPPVQNPLQQMMDEQSRQTRIFLARQSSANKLPTFSGNPLDWPLFISQYRQTTRDCQFSAEENMTRLEKALKGEARQLVLALMIVRGNAEAIIKRLEERYGRSEYIIQALVERAKSTPPLKDHNIRDILDFSASISNLVTTVESLKLLDHLKNPQLLKELVDKLTNSLKMQWGTKVMEMPSYDLRDFDKWIQKKATAVGYVSTPTFSLEDSASPKKGKGRKSESTFVTVATSTQSSQPAQSSKNGSDVCPACQKMKHRLYQCDMFKSMPINSRWDIVKKSKLCFTCLSPSHPMKECKSRSCTVANCNRRHNTLLHGSEIPGRQEKSDSPVSSASTSKPSETKKPEEINGNINSNTTSVMLRVIPVELFGPSGSVTVNALLDEASTVTLLDAEVAAQLGLVGRLDPLRMTWTNGTSQTDNSSQRVSCQIGPVGKDEKFTLANVRTVKSLNLPAQKVDFHRIVKTFPHFAGMKFHILRDEPPALLIGQPQIHLTVARSVKEGSSSEPVATHTRLGWVIHGPTSAKSEKVQQAHYTLTCIHETDDDLLHNLVKEQFAIDSIGIKTVTSNRSREDQEAERVMKQITRRVDNNRWKTGLLWRRETGFVPHEFPHATSPSIPREHGENVVQIASGGERGSSSVQLVCPPQHAEWLTPHERDLAPSTSVPCLTQSHRAVLDPQSVGRENAGLGSFLLPPSRDVAHRRMLILERKFRKTPGLQQQFAEKIQHYISSGYARQLSPEELATSTNREWYLPVFAATHANKPGKIRLVWDAASKSRGRCLNDFLYTGADLLSSLPGILLKFRRGKYAISGDITEMFHQVKIREEDWPAQRFLWRSDPSEEPSTFQLEVMMFGSSCSPYCAQYIRNCNAQQFSQTHPAACDAILNRHYMDDYLESCNSEKEAIQLIKEVSHVHKQGGFHIGKWIANSPTILQQISVEDRATSTKDLSEWSEIPTERALGLHWNPSEDMFTFRVNFERAGDGIASGERIPTKRAILRLIMLVWDPLGFLAHYLITARIILQHLWRSKVGWDDEIPDTIFHKWRKWVQQLPSIREIKIPRQYFPHAQDSSNVQLHVFADASEVAYSSISFLRVLSDDGVQVSFVLGKSRVAPLKPTTIPRLELQAAHMAARMGSFIKEEIGLPISSVHYWSDNGTVLKWIRNEARRFQQFVANRVGEIHERSDVNQWRWVPTKLNPADDATREGHADLSPSSRWWKGPDFLRLPESEWPTEPACLEAEVDEYELELKNDLVCVHTESPTFPHLPDISRFSRYNRLVRCTAHVLMFLEKMKKKDSQHHLKIEEAERHLFVRSQWECYPEEMSSLTKGEPIPKTSKLFQLAPTLDSEGMMRSNTRLATVPEEYLRLPIILQPKSQLSRLLVLHTHQQAHHHSPNYIHNELRQKFWIPSAKTTVRSIVRSCGVCRLRRMKLPPPPLMGNLPAFRVEQQQRPFSIVGMDYFGPFEVTVKRSHEKRYGVLFTCLSTRAVHLEVAHSLTTDSCIMAIRRFAARRGQPLQIHSDNGTNLRGAEKELRANLEELNQSRLKDELEVQRIKWFFLSPASPHMAGVWERLVRSVKNALMFIMKCRYPKDEVLLSFFAEAEAVVNSRPLTDVSIEPESPEAITPFHFLIGTSSIAQPPGVFDRKEVDLGKKWRQTQALVNMFWERWRKEYIPTLQQRKKWLESVPNLEVGDVIVLFDESLRRGSWPLGVVTCVHPGDDGVVRVVDVRTATGNYRRPAVKVARIGIHDVSAQKGNPNQDLGGRDVSESSEGSTADNATT